MGSWLKSKVQEWLGIPAIVADTKALKQGQASVLERALLMVSWRNQQMNERLLPLEIDLSTRKHFVVPEKEQPRSWAEVSAEIERDQFGVQ